VKEILGTVDHGAESCCHGGSTYALLMPPRCRFGTKIHDAETRYLGAMFHSAKLGVHFLKSFLQGCICGILSRKGLKAKKSGPSIRDYINHLLVGCTFARILVSFPITSGSAISLLCLRTHPSLIGGRRYAVTSAVCFYKELTLL
jgi:hypothetical protein